MEDVLHLALGNFIVRGGGGAIAVALGAVDGAGGGLGLCALGGASFGYFERPVS